MWKIRFLSVLLGSFHEAHIQTFAFSMKLYFKIWLEWDVPLLKFHLFYILNESYKEISLQVCLLFTILNSFLLVGLWLCCWQQIRHQENLKPVFLMEQWYAQMHCICITGQKFFQKKNLRFHSKHTDSKNIFSPMIVHPTYHYWLQLITAGSLKG